MTTWPHFPSFLLSDTSSVKPVSARQTLHFQKITIFIIIVVIEEINIYPFQPNPTTALSLYIYTETFKLVSDSLW